MIALASLTTKFHDLSQKCIIAIDGTAASGKGTIASFLAKNFYFIHCQTSLFYRSLALKVLNHNLKPQDKDQIIALSKEQDFDLINSSDLYTESVTKMTSIIATIPEVRQNLFPMQRNFISTHPRVVMEGRDIGTVIAPDADIKIYITADENIRAQRRFNQLSSNGKSITIDEILTNIKERDERDTSRNHGPLKPAKDAFIIDSSSLNVQQIIDLILQRIDNR